MTNQQAIDTINDYITGDIEASFMNDNQQLELQEYLYTAMVNNKTLNSIVSGTVGITLYTTRLFIIRVVGSTINVEIL